MFIPNWSTMDFDSAQDSIKDIKVLIQVKFPEVPDPHFDGLKCHRLLAHWLEELRVFKEIELYPINEVPDGFHININYLKAVWGISILIHEAKLPTTGAILKWCKGDHHMRKHPFLLLRLDLVMACPISGIINLRRQLLDKNISFQAIMVAAKVDSVGSLDVVAATDNETEMEVCVGKPERKGKLEKIGGSESCSKLKKAELVLESKSNEHCPMKVSAYRRCVSGWINTRLYLLNPSIFRLGIEFSEEGEIEDDLIPRLVEEGTLYMFPHDGIFFDMPDGYDAGFDRFFLYMNAKAPANTICATGKNIWIHDTCEIDPGCILGPNVIVGPGCQIEKGASLDNSILIGGKIKVCKSATISNAIIVSDGEFEEGSTVSEMSILGNVTVARNVTVAKGVTVTYVTALLSGSNKFWKDRDCDLLI